MDILSAMVGNGPSAAPNSFGLSSNPYVGQASAPTDNYQSPQTDGGISPTLLSILAASAGKFGSPAQPADTSALGKPQDVPAYLASLAANKAAGNGGGWFQGLAPAAPTEQDILNGILGAAPKLSDFYSAQPYSDALGTLSQGQTTGQSTIDSAYNKAVGDFGALQGQAQTQQAQQAATLQQDSSAASTQLQQAIAPFGDGSQAASAQQSAELAAMSGGSKQTMDLITALQNSNLGQAKAGLASQHQNATDQLSGSITAAKANVTNQETTAAAAGQKQLDAANVARTNQGNAMIAAAQKAAVTAQGQAPTPKAMVQQQIASMAGDPTSAGVLSAFNTIVNGDAAHPLDPAGKAATNIGTAMQRLNSSLAAAEAAGMSPAEGQALQAMVTGWYNTTPIVPSAPSQSDVMAQLKALYGGGVTQ